MMIFSKKSQGYRNIPPTDDSEQHLSVSLLSRNHSHKPKCIIWALAIIIVATSAISIVIGCQIGAHFSIVLDTVCARHTTKYSPILEDVIVKYGVTQFNGSFTHENIYRHGAGPEVDAAWDALGISYRPSILRESQAAKSGLTDNHQKVNQKYGGGYPVFVEGLHQLHCLNLVRKSLYYNYDYYHTSKAGEFEDPDQVVRWHVSHCLDFIRQRLMCTMDTGVFGSVWVDPSDPQPFTDFNTKHVCKNFDSIRAWAERAQIPEHVPDDYWEMPGPDVKIWELAP